MATLKETVYQTLRDDEPLHTLLGKTATPYGVYWLAPPKVPAFPLLTYFINTQINDFPREIPFMITAWSDNFTLILDRVYTLLHEKTIVATDYGHITLIYDWSSPELYDDNYHIHYRQDRFIATAIRSI